MLRVERTRGCLVHRLHRGLAPNWRPAIPHPLRLRAPGDDQQELGSFPAVDDQQDGSGGAAAVVPVGEYRGGVGGASVVALVEYQQYENKRLDLGGVRESAGAGAAVPRDRPQPTHQLRHCTAPPLLPVEVHLKSRLIIVPNA